MYIPDESFIPTMATVSDTQLQPDGSWTVKQDYQPLAKYHFQFWQHRPNYHGKCYGKRRHNICVLGKFSNSLKKKIIQRLKIPMLYTFTFIHCPYENE